MGNWFKQNWFRLLTSLLLVFGVLGFVQFVDNSRYTFEVLSESTVIRCDKINNQCIATSVDLNPYD